MKKSYLAAAAILGAAVFAGQAHAVKIDLGGGKSFKMGVRGVIDAKYLGKRDNNDKADLRFIHRFARFYAKGNINKMISFGFQTEFFANADKSTKPYEIIDSFVNIKLADEFNAIAGSYKLPFERHAGINSEWAVLFPLGTGGGAFTNPTNEGAPFRSGSRSAGLTFWGNIAGGMIKYYAGIFDVTDENKSNPTKPAYALRVQFTPTMMGYKPEKGYVLKDTYTGKKDVLTIGVAYATQKVGSTTGKSFGVDLLWEQNLGGIVPNISLGYVDHKDFRGTNGDDRKGYLVQGGVMLNTTTPLGKPAFVFRWNRLDPKGSNNNVDKIGVGVNLYVKGATNRIALAVDRTNNEDSAKKDYTDVVLSLFYNF